MKKVLLFVCAAVASISVNAQQEVNFDKTQSKGIELKKEIRPIKDSKIKVSSEIFSSVKDFSNIKKSLKAPAQNDIYGNYVEDHLKGDVLHVCNAATVQKYEEEGKEYVNLILDNGYADIVGTYDAATGKITCSAQVCHKHETYGQFAFYGYDAATDKLLMEVTFTVDNEKNISLDQDAYYIMLIDEGDYKGYGWDGIHTSTFLSLENGKFSYDMAGSEWTALTDKVSIEDYEYSLNVHNFINSTVSIDINDDLTVSMPTNQPIMETSKNADKEVYGDYINIAGARLEGSSIYKDYDATEVKGVLKDNTITFDYFTLASKADADGGSYGAFIRKATLTLNDGNFLAAGTTGIEEIGVTREEKIKNTKTYNLMGQQVNRATAKGLLIRDGKKYINKK